MTAPPALRRTRRPVLRPSWVWQLRQGSVLVYVIWFAVAVPLAVIGLVLEPRWVGWMVTGWFLVLLALTGVLRLFEYRERRAWSRTAEQLGWHTSATKQELLTRWPFPPFDTDPAAEVVDVTTGSHRGREFATGRFRYQVGRRQLGFDFLDLHVDRPLPPLQVLPTTLASLAKASLLPIQLDLPASSVRYCLYNGREDHALAVLHPRAVEILAGVPPFGFSCEGRRFVAVLAAYRGADTAIAQLDAACDLLDVMPEQVWRSGEQWAAQQQS